MRMNVEIFVENVKSHCLAKGVSLSKACIESGAGKTLMDNVKRGRVPSVDSVQLLARYLGVTVSELLGESTLGSQARAAPSEHLAQSAQNGSSGEQKEPIPVDGDGQGQNVIKIAGRDGSLIERRLTDEQVTALKLMLAQLPEVEDL